MQSPLGPFKSTIFNLFVAILQWKMSSKKYKLEGACVIETSASIKITGPSLETIFSKIGAYSNFTKS